MPTTIDRFFGVVQLCQNLSTMQNNMRANVLDLQANFHGTRQGDSPLQGNLPAVQQAIRDLGKAFQQRLAMNKAVTDNFQSEVQAGATAIGVAPADLASVFALLNTWATNMSTATFADGAALDTQVAALLAAVPPAMLAF